jgi:hypothetical protein
MKRDIFFYWTGKEPIHKFEGVRRVFPTARFIKLQKNPVKTAKHIAHESRTVEFWLMSIDTIVENTIDKITIPEWDQKYVHVFNNDSVTAFLVPKAYQYNASEIEIGHFENKKIFESTDVKNRPYDIFFLSYDEEFADDNWKTLVKRFQYAERIQGITGIFNAHLEAAKKSTTDYFWVVDADAAIEDTFKFEYKVSEWDFDVVHIWKSRNAVNGLEYGHGGVKLIPKFILLTRADKNAIDVTTSIGSKITVFDEISNTNNFAVTPLTAWRAGFREAAKLTSQVVSRRNDKNTATRLEAWCNVNQNHPLGSYVLAGARLGKKFGMRNIKNKPELALINDYAWLESKFEEYIVMSKRIAEFMELNQQPEEKSQQ